MTAFDNANFVELNEQPANALKAEHVAKLWQPQARQIAEQSDAPRLILTQSGLPTLQDWIRGGLNGGNRGNSQPSEQWPRDMSNRDIQECLRMSRRECDNFMRLTPRERDERYRLPHNDRYDYDRRNLRR